MNSLRSLVVQPSTQTLDTSSIFHPIKIELLDDIIVDFKDCHVDSNAMAMLVEQALELEESGSYHEAYEKFNEISELPSSLGFYFLGIMERHGIGIEVDTVLAFEHFQKAAKYAEREQNYAQLALILLELGICRYYGWGVEKGKQVAVCYFQMAAQLGDPDALLELAKCYLKGKGIEKNKFLAAQCYQLAEKHDRIIPGNSWIHKEKYTRRL